RDPWSRGFSRQAAHDMDRTGRRECRAVGGRHQPRRRRHLAQGISLRAGPERHGWHLADSAQPGGRTHPASARVMSTYDVTDELLVEEDGPIRIIRLNRPEHLNATNHGLHRGLA